MAVLVEAISVVVRRSHTTRQETPGKGLISYGNFRIRLLRLSAGNWLWIIPQSLSIQATSILFP